MGHRMPARFCSPRRSLMLLCLVLWACLIHVASAQEAPPLTDIPDPMPLADEGNDDFIHFLLLGSDTTNPANAGRSDVLLIVSVNRTAGTVGMLSLPRDLWVYVPGWEMRKINVVFAHGENSGAGGHGAQVIADTIRYNLGLSI